MPLPPLAPGLVIDGFRLEEQIHTGSMATLWRVSGRPDHPPMVMKLPQLTEGGDPTAVVGFEVEKMILPTLSGVHVPRFIAAADFPAQPYVVMELIPGPSLRARLADAPLPPAEVASVGARVAAALHDIHGQHVIHLDLKPSNVMFRASGEAVLIDFGFSRHDRLPDLLAEQFRLPMGTGPYISPEQVLHIRNDPRSDLFGLGVVLYHLATGTRPFGNPVSVRGLRRRLYRDPVPPRALAPGLPGFLQEIILRCLEPDPARRYDTAAQAAFDLAHPEQVKLTARAERTRQDGVLTVARRWLHSVGAESDPRQSAAGQLARAPIVLVAVDVAQASDALLAALRVAARRVFDTEPGARLACVTVVRTHRIAIESNADEGGQNLRVKHLVELKHWARPLGLPPGRITFHVLESPDVGAAIVEFAATNQVDQVVIGSRGSSPLRRYMGSVSSKVVAEAECSVTVVKAAESPAGPRSDGAPAGLSADGADRPAPGR
ncbi:MAG TPA: bifunctional serine/threonine-protein kinase/universal stress protein [Myxococcaceae bacterium]|jgi:nucleotide-binding universal stress UspA family protein|nr:bifunctional serine/threonine-protein kinase/universal stress protein [Myxococcaceae bacterium]